jgi:hypothetical protein
MKRGPAPSLDVALVRSASVVGRKVAGEYVLVPLAGSAADIDSVYGLNAVGAFIWERLDGRRRGHDIVRSLEDAYVVDTTRATADYLDFVSSLLAVGAVEQAP